jgi:hypothetical protein
MKISILTYHDGPNHGAFLQAYSLLMTIKKFGYEVEIINYKNFRHWYIEGVKYFINAIRTGSFFFKYRKYIAFKRTHKKFGFKRNCISSKRQKRKKYGCVVIGSDVVWNYKIFGFDDVYFGNLNAQALISYAASFGWANDISELPKCALKELKKINKLSVRDNVSQNILKNTLGVSAPIMLDPTLIYDFKDDLNLTSTNHTIYDKTLVVYSYLNNNYVIEQIKQYAANNGLKTVCTGYIQSWCDLILPGLDPFEWVGLISKADTVLTSTFHGVVFALKFRKKIFYLCNKKAYSRVNNLLETCGLNEYCIDNEDGTLVYIDPDYDNVTKQLNISKKKSLKWLRSALLETTSAIKT